MRDLYIRTEANRTIATGHMMRCLSIAEAAKRLGYHVVFIVAEEEAGELAEQRGFEVICLHTRWDDFTGEIPVMENLIKEKKAEGHPIEVLLIDSYFVSKEYMEQMNQYTKVVYIDDLYQEIWPCSILINYAIYAKKFPYKRDYKNVKCLLGCEYFPLRDDFRNDIAKLTKRKIRDDVEEILVVTGGADEIHFMKSLAKEIVGRQEQKIYNHFPKVQSYEQIHFTMVCGKYNVDLEEIQGITKNADNITVIDALPSLKDAMLNADMIITAGGTTLYEMAAQGLPGIIFQIAENQKWNVETFEEEGYVISIGDISEQCDMTLLFEKMNTMIKNVNLRQRMSDRLYSLIDGNGAERIVTQIFEE